ncbi:hypothetical protein GCM10023149_28710 [Mucilaginibacter gynuensis]|uniref:DUF4421 domain-containing protein n=1 Tax=Mucilaginibacter gynuensis TaxID=1302236 RepID=A0ABP8GKJ6_9SPHI
MRYVLTIIIILFVGQTVYAQDFITDRNNAGKPVFFKSPSDTGKVILFSLGANVSDATAIKLNVYNHKWGTKPRNYTTGSGTDIVKHTDLTAHGWGAYVNTKNKEGVAKIFKSGNFDPGVTGGGYYAWNFYRTRTENGKFKTSNSNLILNGDVSFGSYQLYDSKADFTKQLTTKNFVGPVIGLGYLIRPTKSNGNVYWTGSVSWARTNNYDDLDTYDIKNDSLISANGITRKVTKMNPNGDTYADAGSYEQFNEYRFRLGYTFIPANLINRFGFSVYPSVYIGGKKSARLNTGLSLSYLEEGNPTVSIFNLSFEFTDISNSAESSKSFLKRTFKVGLSTNLNVFKKL